MTARRRFLQGVGAALSPPRKHYWWYCAGREANDNLWRAPQGVHDLLRENFHFKSADSKDNKPFALKSWTASELAKMPRYYIMDLGKGMAGSGCEISIQRIPRHMRERGAAGRHSSRGANSRTCSDRRMEASLSVRAPIAEGSFAHRFWPRGIASAAAGTESATAGGAILGDRCICSTPI